MPQKTFVSDVSKQEFPITQRVSARSLRDSILGLIQQDHPDFNSSNSLSVTELNAYRQKYISSYVLKEVGEITELERTVIQTLSDKATLSLKVDPEEEFTGLTLGQRIADKVALFGGSWWFISSFSLFILLWLLSNLFWLKHRTFDPYPFILLNLILSCVAAFQAPVIMMSQKRQEEKDRERSRRDYMINLKAELEIRMLHEKLDHLILHQQQELVEIQKVQMDMLADILKVVSVKPKV